MFLKSVAVFLIAAGLFFAAFGVYFIALGYEAEGWVAVEGEVTSVTVQVDVSLSQINPSTGTRSASSANKYYPLVAYRWTVDGETYEGDRYRLGETHEKFLDKGDAIVAASKYRNGMPITVYYNVDYPNQAVLNPSLSVGVFVPLPLGLLLLVCGWALLKSLPVIERSLAAQAASSSGN